MPVKDCSDKGAQLLGRIQTFSKFILDAADRKDYVAAIVSDLQLWSGCQCVGIRIVDPQKRMPYEAYTGFSQEFWEAENCLSLTEHQCGCIRVVTGTPDPLDREILTPAGSLFTNDLQGFAKCVPQDCLHRYRGKCIASDFQSLAVIPLRYRTDVIGLIHMADLRQDALCYEDVLLIESLSGVIGEVIHRYDVAAKLKAKQHEVNLLQERFESIARNLFDWLWEIDVHSVYTYCSDKSFEFIGYPPEDIIGKTPFDFMPDEQAAAARTFFARVVNDKRPFRDYENWNLHKDGHLICLLSSGVPFFAADGSLLGYRGADLDITERKQSQAELTRATQLAAIGELATGVAHEINNPITGVINCAELLRNRSYLTEKDREILARIIREGGRIASITHDLLFFASDSGKKKTYAVAQELLSSTLGLVGCLLDKDGVDLTLDLDEKPLEIFVNPQQVEQVWLNLISNARHALQESRSAGQTLNTLQISMKRITLKERLLCRTTFTDNGPGIPGQVLKQIFQPFFTTKPAGVGTGLGLSISRKIIKSFDGELTITSQEGENTRVIVDLPLVSKALN